MEDTIGGCYLVWVNTKVSNGEFERIDLSQIMPSYCVHHTLKRLMTYLIFHRFTASPITWKLPVRHGTVPIMLAAQVLCIKVLWISDLCFHATFWWSCLPCSRLVHPSGLLKTPWQTAHVCVDTSRGPSIHAQGFLISYSCSQQYYSNLDLSWYLGWRLPHCLVGWNRLDTSTCVLALTELLWPQVLQLILQTSPVGAQDTSIAIKVAITDVPLHLLPLHHSWYFSFVHLSFQYHTQFFMAWAGFIFYVWNIYTFVS